MIWNCYHFKRWNIEFTRNWFIFKNSYLFKNKIKCHLPKKLYAFFITICKNIIQKFIRVKNNLGKKTCSPFFKVMSLACFILFVPIYHYQTKSNSITLKIVTLWQILIYTTQWIYRNISKIPIPEYINVIL
jgi:hypothetical protein